MDYLISHSLAEGALITGLKVAPVHSPCPSEAQGQAEQQDRRHAAEKSQRGKLSKRRSGIPNNRLRVKNTKKKTDSQNFAKVQHTGVKLRRNTKANRHLDFEPCVGI